MPETESTRYVASVTEHVRLVAERNHDAVTRAARLVVRAGRTGHLVYAAGAGHSLGGVLEMFFRAGGLPFVSPLWHPDILPLNGARASTEAERRDGLGRSVAEAAEIGEQDVVMIFSNSGINPYPVEIARCARAVGAPVIAVTSPEASRLAPARAGARLYEIADVVLDTCVPSGDVTWPSESPRIAPASSLSNTLCWNMVMVEALSMDPDLPAWRSANSGGTDDHNQLLRTRYGVAVPSM